MALCKITEYRHATQQGPNLVPTGIEPSETVQNVTFGVATLSAPFGPNTNLIRIKADAKVYFKCGKPGATTATANDTDIEANCSEWFGVIPGYVLSLYDGTS